MNCLRAKQAVATLLVFCVLVVGGLASTQSIAHEWHHAHHQKATHGTVLCSWLCAAGQALDGISAPNLIERSPSASPDLAISLFVPQPTFDVTTSRAPPFHPTI
jgi:hypothetical protein